MICVECREKPVVAQRRRGLQMCAACKRTRKNRQTSESGKRNWPRVGYQRKLRRAGLLDDGGQHGR